MLSRCDLLAEAEKWRTALDQEQLVGEEYVALVAEVLENVWVKRGRVHEGVMESKERGMMTSMYCCGGAAKDLRWWKWVLERWSGGDEVVEFVNGFN